MVQRYIDELRLLHAMRLAVLATDIDGRISFANDAAAAAYAATADELLGCDVKDLLGGPPPAEPPLELEKVLAGQTWHGPLMVRRLRGETFVAAVSATPIRDAQGTVLGAVIVAEDMTEIGRVEAQVAAGQERLRLAHEAAELGSWQWDMATGVVVWDAQMEAIYGLPPGGFGSSFEAWEATLHPEDHDRIMSIVEDALAKCSPYVFRNRIIWPDGEVRWIEAHGKVTTDGQGNPTGTIGCVRDVTERVRAEQRMHAAAARASLLQEASAGFVAAKTVDEVDAVLAHALDRAVDIIGTDVAVSTGGRRNDAGVGLVVDVQPDPSPEDAQLVDTLTAQHAIAAERAVLHSRTAEISERLQSSLVASELPAVDGLELAVHHVPGGDSLERVGGDWYDAVRTPTGDLALVVGDVMGRGVDAATSMIRIRAGIRGILTVDPSPDQVLATADELLNRDAPDLFVTAVAALLNPSTQTIALCNAGHVPIVVVHPDGSSALLGNGSGTPLGLNADRGRTIITANLEPGATVLMVTDGVIESRTHDIDQGIARLRERATTLRAEPLPDLVADLADLADTSLRDDLTILAVRLN